MILFRPVCLDELRFVYESRLTAFPPGPPIFHAVPDEESARRIARDWSTTGESLAGFVTRFTVDDACVAEFDRHVVGDIDVVAAYFGDGWRALVEDQSALADMLDRLADAIAIARDGDVKCLRALREEALVLYRELAASDPDERIWLAVALDDCARAATSDGDLPCETAFRHEAIVHLRPFLADHPDDSFLLNTLGSALRSRGRRRFEGGDLDGARADAEEAAAVLRAGAAADPSDFDDLAGALELAVDVACKRKDGPAELAASREWAETLRLILPRPEADKWTRHDLGRALRSIADAHWSLGDIPAARASYEEALAFHRELSAAAPDDSDLAGDLLWVLGRSADVLEDAGDLDAALGLRIEAVALSRSTADRDPSSDARDDVCSALTVLAELRWTRDEREQAADAYREAVAIARALAAEFPDDHDWLLSIAIPLAELREVLDELGEKEEALAAAREVVSLQRKITADGPNDLEMLRELLVDLDQLGDLLRDTGDASGAADAYEHAESIARGLVATDGANTRWRDDLAIVLGRRGRLALDGGAAATAVAAFAESADECRVLVAREPDVVKWRRKLGQRLADVGEAHAAAGDPQAALVAYDEAAALLVATRGHADGAEDDAIRETLADAADTAASAGRPDLAQALRARAADLDAPG